MQQADHTCLLCQSEWLTQLGPADRLQQEEVKARGWRAKKDRKAGQQIFTQLLCKHLWQCCILHMKREFKNWRNDILQRHCICLKSVHVILKGPRSRWMSANQVTEAISSSKIMLPWFFSSACFSVINWFTLISFYFSLFSNTFQFLFQLTELTLPSAARHESRVC